MRRRAAQAAAQRPRQPDATPSNLPIIAYLDRAVVNGDRSDLRWP
jgi:hypothetical protein